MTQSLVVPAPPSVTPSGRAGLPDIPPWAIARSAVADRLDVGVSGLLTVVSGPTGAGKTIGVASWASGAELSGGVIWLNVARGGADPDIVWRHLHNGFVEAGASDLPQLPTTSCPEARRIGMLADFGVALRNSAPWVLVLDDYPTGPPGRLERELEIVLAHARRGLRVVIINQSEPALDLHRHDAAGELTQIAGDDLVMDSAEVGAVLRAHGVDSTKTTVATVMRHTVGWACGVRHAAVSLRDAPTLSAAMDAADRAVSDYLTREVLAPMPTASRELIVRTSIVGHVSPGLARAVVGAQAGGGADLIPAPSAFVDVERDGSFSCRPLLRAAALTCLHRECPELARQARRAAASWYVDQGDVGAALELARETGDWPFVARLLVDAYAVPRLLAGTASDAVESAAALAAAETAEPLLVAAVALGRGDVDVAHAALRAVPVPSSGEERETPLAERFAITLAHLVLLRQQGNSAKGLRVAATARRLLTELPMARRDDLPELSPMLDANKGALEVCRGDLHAAARTLAHGARVGDASGVSHRAHAECAGQLALVEAFRGNLSRAARLASAVLVDDDADPCLVPAPGNWYAQLAQALVHVEREEFAPARGRLERSMIPPTAEHVDPWLRTARQLVEARLLMAAGGPEGALRLLAAATNRIQSTEPMGWLADQLVIGSAEALLAAGEPQRALAEVTPAPTCAPVEAGVLTALGRWQVGDVRGSRAALAAVGPELDGAPLGCQVSFWLLEARLAHDDGDVGRAHVLVSRALRAAASEHLRRPLSSASGWLRRIVDRDAMLRREHRDFLTSIPTSPPPVQHVRAQTSSLPPIVETLSEREVEVLELLAQMCSTGEIAGELYVSVNTVKTHLKGIFRKLCVNRRVEAVRRGRELGLC